ncbi:amidohydrolase family protein [Streptomyces longwoodensis]
MIIDAHSHVHDPVEAHVGLLEEAGADRAVLFATRPHPERAGDLASLRREMAVLEKALGGRAGTVEAYRGAWRELDAALAAYPDRFIGFLSVPLGLGAEETAAIVEQEVLGRGLRGIGELTPPPGGAALVEPVLRAAADQGRLPVVVHANVVFAVRVAIKEIPDRTLFGSDAPYGDPVLARALVERVTSPGVVRDLVLGGTIAELLGSG